MREDKKTGFLDEYIKLCKKYNMIINSCGCCDSPWLDEIDEKGLTQTGTCVNIDQHRVHLEEDYS